MSQFPTKESLVNRILSQSDCMICLNPFERSSLRVVRALPCGHCFDQECLKQWMQVNKTCPACRYDLSASNDQEDSSSQSEWLSGSSNSDSNDDVISDNENS